MFYRYPLSLTFFASVNFWLKLWGEKIWKFELFFAVLFFKHCIFDEHNNANPVAERWGASAARQVVSVMLFSRGHAGY